SSKEVLILMDEPSRQGSIIYVRYRDHVLFRNTDQALYKPVLRETVGWLEKESPEAIWILWERSAEPLPRLGSPDGKIPPKPSRLNHP
ncbi:MAG: hypothetical protein QMD23_08480, partial [Candidatus Bathyarchaeia archaeon]|nr:hypothetical protein [Candidatus Bathyarchaeia archaeon]